MTPELGYTDNVMVFDLDDTLYPEKQYVLSGFSAVAERMSDSDNPKEELYEIMTTAAAKGLNSFDALAETIIPHDYNRFIACCVDTYRNHKPHIRLYPAAAALLAALSDAGVRMALVTDGTQKRQMAKIDALGIRCHFPHDMILISEQTGCDKLGLTSWQRIVRKYPNAHRFIYIGDNPAKDFIWPNRLGWITIGIRNNGENIHPQTGDFPIDNQPQYWVESHDEILKLLTSI